MLLCDNCNGGYHLFCLKPKLIQVFAGIWYYSSCSFAAPWFLLRPCHVFCGSGLGRDTWNFHFSLLLCIVYIRACIFFWLISFYLWLVLVFLFSRIYYGFTPLQHRTSWHYTSQQDIFLMWYLTQHGVNSLQNTVKTYKHCFVRYILWHARLVQMWTHYINIRWIQHMNIVMQSIYSIFEEKNMKGNLT